MKLLTLFPHSVGQFKLNVDNKKILKHIKKLKYKKTHVKYTDSSSLISKDYSVLNQLPLLKKQILKSVQEYSNSHNYFHKKYKIQCSWCTLTKEKCFGQFHYHAHSFISGVYYPKKIKDCSIVFQNPFQNLFWNQDVKEHNYINSTEFTLPIEDNMLLLFHHYIKHKININLNSEDRYSIAFNVTPYCSLGYEDVQIKIS